jgi:hypothetical protein
MSAKEIAANWLNIFNENRHEHIIARAFLDLEEKCAKQDTEVIALAFTLDQREAELARKTKALEEIADMEGQEEMNDHKFAEAALKLAAAALEGK